jgi:signal transduction histidine kinase
MTRTVELDNVGHDTAAPGRAGPAAWRDERGAGFVFPARARRVGSLAAGGAAVVAVLLTPLAPAGRDGFVVAHALTAVPLLAASLVWARRAGDGGAPEYVTFWHHWARACALGLGAAVAGAASPLWPPLLDVDFALMLAAVPFWAAAGREALAISSGRRDPAVDMIDGLTAIVVLGSPGVLLLAEPLLAQADPAVAVPLAFFLAIAPAGLYGAVLGVARAPGGERVAHGLGVAVVGTFGVSVALQLGRLTGGLDLPVGVFVGVHAANLAVVATLPLWAHRTVSSGLGRLPVERQVRRHNPMPALSAAVLPVLAVYVLAWRRGDGWAVTYLVVVVLTAVVLNAVRLAMLTRETRRLAGELAQAADERRRLLGDMVRALDDDRHRIVSELHAQAVGSLSTLGTVVQTACVSLPASTALAVREAIAQLQGDLSVRAEELRTLLVALRPLGADGADGVAGGHDALAPALRAYAADLCDAVPLGARPRVIVEVGSDLDLDRRTATIAYRIAQEALLTAVVHARARTITVRLALDEPTGGVVVEVTDDGEGLDLGAVAGGACLPTLELFTDLGHGELTVRTVPGEGTAVRSRLGGRGHPIAVAPAEGRHLRLV